MKHSLIFYIAISINEQQTFFNQFNNLNAINCWFLKATLVISINFTQMYFIYLSTRLPPVEFHQIYSLAENKNKKQPNVPPRFVDETTSWWLRHHESTMNYLHSAQSAQRVSGYSMYVSEPCLRHIFRPSVTSSAARNVHSSNKRSSSAKREQSNKDDTNAQTAFGCHVSFTPHPPANLWLVFAPMVCGPLIERWRSIVIQRHTTNTNSQYSRIDLLT